jgi:aspartate aminotransferase-like enzyme
MLLTPGPTAVPPEVLEALSRPVLHHRSPDFKLLFGRVQERLRAVFETAGDVLVHTSSGTGAFESALVNLLSPGERVLAVSSGAFGERWQAMARALGCDVRELRYPWGAVPDATEIEHAAADSGATVAVLVHSETSTGVVLDLEACAAAARSAGALVVVDAISSLGAVPLRTDAWKLDVVVTGSQKALMTPPGLAFVAVGERAWAKSREATLPRFYWDWERARAAQAKDNTAFTPAVSTVVALDVALELLLGEGLERAFARHVALGRSARAGVKALGLELYSPDDDSAAVLTAALTPDGVDAVDLRLSLRDRFALTVAGGHGDIVDRLFRIGHIGYVDVFDVARALAAIEVLLGEAGREVEPGAGVAAALAAHENAAAV